MASDQEIAATLCGDHIVFSTDPSRRCESCDAIAACLATARAEGHAAGVAQAAHVADNAAVIHFAEYMGNNAMSNAAKRIAQAIRALTPAPAAPPRAEKEA